MTRKHYTTLSDNDVYFYHGAHREQRENVVSLEKSIDLAIQYGP